jgi:hypothetical protein
MSTIQDQFLVYHRLESILRDAALNQQPVSVQDLWENPGIRERVNKLHNIRDKIKVLSDHRLITKVSVPQSQGGDRRVRVAYMWADTDKHADDELRKPLPREDKASTQVRSVQSTPAKPPSSQPSRSTLDVEIEVNGLRVFAGTNVEMFVQDVKCVVDKNPDTGTVRIIIV